MTSATSYRRLKDVETTSCVYWVGAVQGWILMGQKAFDGFEAVKRLCNPFSPIFD